MKKLSYILANGSNWVLAALLSGLGFSSCDRIEGGGGEMYGTPYATFYIKGKVTDKEGTPIAGLQIKCATGHTGDGRTWLEAASETQTAADGTFDTRFDAFPTNKVRVYATDTDGAANGSFANDSIDIAIAGTDYKGKKGWFSGSVEKDTTLQLKDKE